MAAETVAPYRYHPALHTDEDLQELGLINATRRPAWAGNAQGQYISRYECLRDQLAHVLHQNEDAHEHDQHEPQTGFGRLTVDTYIPEWRVALEADGCLWNGCPVCTLGEDITRHETHRNIRDDILYRHYNVTAVHIWGHSLLTMADSINAVLTRLAPWMDEER